jgi:PEP-CTERM motif
LWNGTANSAVGLAPAGFTNSTAYGTDGVASYSGGSYAVEWSPVPEPSTIVLSVLGAVGFAASALRRRAKRQRDQRSR